MSFLNDIFAKKNRKEFESTLEVTEWRERENYNEKMRCDPYYRYKHAPNEETKKKLSDMLDIISSVPEGKKLLNNITAMGYSICFDSTKNGMGSHYASQKKLLIDPNKHKSVAGMAVTLYHEMTHAMQAKRAKELYTNASKLNIADGIKLDRACEAAACTEEYNFAWQIKDKHPDVLQDVSGFPMWGAFSAEMEKSGDATKAGEACFKAWYSFPAYQKSYEKQYADNLTYSLKTRETNKDKNAFRASVSSEDVLKHAFTTEALKKNISADFLTSKEAFSVTEETVAAIDAEVDKYVNKVPSATKDTSHYKMYSYRTGKTYAEEKQTAASVNGNAALAAALLNKAKSR